MMGNEDEEGDDKEGEVHMIKSKKQKIKKYGSGIPANGNETKEIPDSDWLVPSAPGDRCQFVVSGFTFTTTRVPRMIFLLSCTFVRLKADYHIYLFWNCVRFCCLLVA